VFASPDTLKYKAAYPKALFLPTAVLEKEAAYAPTAVLKLELLELLSALKPIATLAVSLTVAEAKASFPTSVLVDDPLPLPILTPLTITSALLVILPVTVNPLPDIRRLPVITADPENGKPDPPAAFKAKDAVIARDALCAQLAVPNKDPVNEPVYEPVNEDALIGPNIPKLPVKDILPVTLNDPVTV
jgi:hypothetical protein